MRITYCMNIPPLYDLEAEIDCDLDWRFEDPIVDVNTVTLNGIELLGNDDPFLRELGGRIAIAVEDDETVLDRLIQADLEAA